VLVSSLRRRFAAWRALTSLHQAPCRQKFGNGLRTLSMRVPLFKGAVRLYPWDKIDSSDPWRQPSPDTQPSGPKSPQAEATTVEAREGTAWGFFVTVKAFFLRSKTSPDCVSHAPHCSTIWWRLKNAGTNEHRSRL
jgi:hypothetical protein